MNNSIPLQKELQTFLSAFSGVLQVSSFFYHEHVLLLESEKKKRRIKRKNTRGGEPMKTYSSPLEMLLLPTRTSPVQNMPFLE